MQTESIYGKIVPAYEVYPIEKKITPISIHTLDDASAPVLKAFLACRPTDFAISRLLFSEMAVLWAITRDDDVKFALEEVIGEESETIRFPKPRRLKLDKRPPSKIGHPGLVGAPFEARISGEIYFDPSPKKNRWMITNQSGRFGLNCGREESHLIAAAQRFAAYGIELEPYFVH